MLRSWPVTSVLTTVCSEWLRRGCVARRSAYALQERRSRSCETARSCGSRMGRLSDGFPTLRTYPGKFFMRNPIVSGKLRAGR
jgi:hypothetical protein